MKLEPAVNAKSGFSLNSIKVMSIPLPLFSVLALTIGYAAHRNAIPNNIMGALAVMIVLGAVLGEIGDRIPYWNEYVGGGTIFAFLGSAFLVYYKIMPKGTQTAIINFIDKQSFLDTFIAVLITGSILGVNRKVLLRAVTGYLPAIFGGIALSFVLGGAVGLLFGVPFTTTILRYALPIMGGGTGAGALPMSDMYASITGGSKEAFLSFAFPILTIGNIICIIFAALLNKLGQKKPELSGNGDLVKGMEASVVEEKTEKIKVGHDLYAAGLALAGFFYVLGRLFSRVLLPKIGGFEIHAFAYMVLFVALANALNLIPDDAREGAKKLQSFFSGQFLWVIMIGVGVAYTDLAEFAGALTIPNIVIAAAIVLGALLGSGLVGMLVGFYPIESGISAGLCMANRGGSGDLAVLGAAKRMSLMPFAQISSRIGGGIMLVIASILFALWK